MAERPVKFVISVEGGAEAERAFSGLEDAQRDVSREARRLSGVQRDAVAQSTAAATAAAAQGIRLEQLGSTIGQVGAVLGRINPQFARMGATIGSIGAQIPALTGSLGPVAAGIAAITIAVDLGTQAFDAYQAHTADTPDRLRDIADAAKEARDELAGLNAALRQQEARTAVEAGAATSRQIETERAAAEAEVDRLRTQLVSLRRDRGDAAAAAWGFEEDAIRDVTDSVESLREAEVRRSVEARLAAAEERATLAGLALAVDAPEREPRRPARRGGARGRQEESEEARRQREAMEFAMRLKAQEAEQIAAIEQAMHDEEMAMIAEAEAVKIKATEDAIARAQREAEATRNAAALQQELERRTQDAEAARQESFDRTAADAEKITGPISAGMNDAIVNMIIGAETAEDAFNNMLRSFLEALATEAGLQAAKEFALAIASFAGQRYDEGALHLLAGGLWTGVAVAAGVGAAAMAPPATPAAPETSGDTGGDTGGGTNVYNINGTVISADGASSRARAGREVGALLDEGVRRYGRVG